MRLLATCVGVFDLALTNTNLNDNVLEDVVPEIQAALKAARTSRNVCDEF